MGDPKKARTSAKPPSSAIGFDYRGKLPNGVPPVELPPTSMFPYQPKIGPGTATYYFPINMSKVSPTGVFFPANYAFPSTMNVILYFHGHKQGDFKTINQYWGGNLHNIRLREDINETGKQAVLIAPTMGEFPGSVLNPDMGIFRDPGGGDAFLGEVAQWIGKYVHQYRDKGITPGIGNVVLAGHSGAGGILSQQAKSMKSNVCEVWGFDSMYGQGYIGKGKQAKPIDVTGNWRDLATASQQPTLEIDFVGILPVPKIKPSIKFWFYWAGGSPGTNSQLLQDKVKAAGLTNVHVEANGRLGGKFHFDTITRNFKTRVAKASCF
jgi:hypothetical protein